MTMTSRAMTVIGPVQSANGRYSSKPADQEHFGTLSLADSQPKGLMLRYDHNPIDTIGELRYLERNRWGAVFAVASIWEGVADYIDLESCYFSVNGSGKRHDRMQPNEDLAVIDWTNFNLSEVSLVPRTGMETSTPVLAAIGDIAARWSRGGWPMAWPGEYKAMCDRALDALPHLRYATDLAIASAPDAVATVPSTPRRRSNAAVPDRSVPPELAVDGLVHRRTWLGDELVESSIVG